MDHICRLSKKLIPFCVFTGVGGAVHRDGPAEGRAVLRGDVGILGDAGRRRHLHLSLPRAAPRGSGKLRLMAYLHTRSKARGPIQGLQ